MDKEEILKKSREENEGIDGEYEESVLAEANRISIYVGSAVCVLLIISSRYLFHRYVAAFGGLFVLFSITASRDIMMFSRLKEKKHLVHAIIEIFWALLSAGMMVYLWMKGLY